jgi:hypothetical protein
MPIAPNTACFLEHAVFEFFGDIAGTAGHTLAEVEMMLVPPHAPFG